ncbi:MAG: FAD-dependent oxidoreductase [Campylobacterales bacterium]|nr:FAD-dependent oxidoreductase [Campylobacterales bacterium]
MYNYVVIGGGIAGSSASYFLNKELGKVALLEQNDCLAPEASGAAGAFLSPMIGKPNRFKDLLTNSLKFTMEFYKKNAPDLIVNKGVLRIPNDIKTKRSFDEITDFDFEPRGEGVFFPVGTLINSVGICEFLSKDVDVKLNYKVTKLDRKDDHWIINDEIKTKGIVLATGYKTDLVDEQYLNVRPVWGQRINISTSTVVKHNYHKKCSISPTFPLKDGKNFMSIGATHHRVSTEEEYDKVSVEEDTETLLERAGQVLDLEDVEVLGHRRGARASSIDYFPIVGKLVDSKSTLEKFPYIKKGSKVPESDYATYEELYIINGIGGRGFVFSPYLANELVRSIVQKREVLSDIRSHRLFKKWARKQ